MIFTEREWIELHKLDEDIVDRCELLCTTYHNGTEAEYEDVLIELRALIARRYPLCREMP